MCEIEFGSWKITVKRPTYARISSTQNLHGRRGPEAEAHAEFVAYIYLLKSS